MSDFKVFSDGTNSYNVKDETARTNLENHMTEDMIPSSAGSHGLRYHDGSFAYKNASGAWVRIDTGSSAGGVPVADVSAVSHSSSHGQVSVCWSDPPNVMISGVAISTWGETVLVRKEGSAPTDVDDGTVVVKNTERDQYASTPYVDSGLEDDIEYFYRFFTYTTGKTETVGTAFSETPTRESVAVPTTSSSLVYDGSAQTPTWTYDTSKITKTETAQSAAGTYSTTFTLNSDAYKWADDGSTDPRVIEWTIAAGTITVVPSQSGSITYNSSSQNVGWSGDISHLTITGDTSGINAGTYTAVFTPNSNYVWSSAIQSAHNVGESDPISVNWTIGRKGIAIPTQTNTLTYDGNVKTPIWSHSEGYTITGTQSSTDAGTFTPNATVDSNHMWSTDSSTGSKQLSWTIGKATSAITVSPSSVTLNTSNKTETVTVGNVLGRTITVSTSDDTVATGSYSNGTLTISHVNQTSGTATITISAAASTNYNASSVTVSVTASFVDTVLNNNDWATIQSIAQAGTGSNYWSVGDRKAVTINGKVGTYTFSNYTAYAYILGFNHNSAKEGTAIHFQFGFDALSGGNHIAFCDSSYGNYNASQCFNMNPASNSSGSTNSGGWNSSKMRTVLIPEFITRLPSALQSALKAITKYTDNTGNSSNVVGNVTTTSDKVFLLAEYEVFGTRSYANQYEYTDGKQAQYDYYKNGNDKIMKNHTSTGSAVYWWERSPFYDNATYFCFVYSSGGATASYSGYSFGFAPGFAVG